MEQASLRTLAHPLRSRILAELRVLGSATSADLARRLDTHTGATSYHVRRLAEVGLVRDTGTGVGRRRVWEVSPRATRNLVAVDADAARFDADGVAALEWLARDYLHHFAEKGQEWISAAGDWAPTWQDACGLDDRLVLVTDEQLAALRAELGDVLARYRRVGAGNPRAKRVAFYTCALPVDPPGRSPSSA
ncbi:MAG: helix-turn-helix domain-containing protein [Dermatophilaceae bacterium]